ncbi:glutactin-like isoform X2 [Thrips palmi]|uniref:Glutactin-like isoform X2 n=1 Tax=Thrips palmi TaxID=161013 RepID=A0A6P8ZGY0_THRPL|nr:glutactin-like isoform X2 [Thrips palmi]
MWLPARYLLLAAAALCWTCVLSADKKDLSQTPLPTLDVVPGLGSIQGTRTLSYWRRRPIYQYQGIPYAEPPSGARRFLPPEPAKPWSSPLKATAFGRRCPQEWEFPDNQPPVSYEDQSVDIEDCLTLNVYTPVRPSTCGGRLLPVMFYIHGGSWRVGTAEDFRPHYLVDRDVVLVVIQYRLGPLGFLSLQSDSVPGNVGLLDQLLALKWVHQHIRHFCGDPDNVTIFGSSSGAASVTLFMISPLVGNELFRRVIFQSGSARCTWLMDDRPLNSARNIAYYANCTNTSDLDKLAACLRAVPPQTLLAAHNQFLDLADGGKATGAGGNHAVVQKAGTQRFLVENPRLSLREGRFKRLPVMGGVTKDEGSVFLGNLYDFYLEPDGRMDDYDYLKHNLTQVALEFSGINDDTGALSDVFRRKFFSESDMGNFTRMTPGLVDMCGVTLLKACTFRMVQENSRIAPSYLYSFNYKGRHTKFGYGYSIEYPFTGGVAHSDDLIYLFPDRDPSDDDEKTARTMVELWTNFATTGVPAPAFQVPKWPPVSTENGPYLRVDRVPLVRDDFLDEYQITVKEGLSAATTTTARPAVAFVAVVLAVYYHYT